MGGISPRRELETSKKEIARLNTVLENRPAGGGWRSPVPGLDRVFRQQPSDIEEEEEEEAARVAREAANADAGVEVAREERRRAWRKRWSETPREERASKFLSTFDRMAAVQDVRRVQSRAALIEQAELSEEEVQALDEVFASLNQELLGHGEELIVLAMENDAPAPRDLLGITHDVTGIMHKAQLALEKTVGTERMQNVEASGLEIWNFVNVGALRESAEAAAKR